MKTSSTIRLGLIGLLACSAFIGAQAMAQDTTIPGHPRVNEVNHRINNQQRRTDNGIANGTGIALANGKTMTLMCPLAGAWFSILSA